MKLEFDAFLSSIEWPMYRDGGRAPHVDVTVSSKHGDINMSLTREQADMFIRSDTFATFRITIESKS